MHAREGNAALAQALGQLTLVTAGRFEGDQADLGRIESGQPGRNRRFRLRHPNRPGATEERDVDPVLRDINSDEQLVGHNRLRLHLDRGPARRIASGRKPHFPYACMTVTPAGDQDTHGRKTNSRLGRSCRRPPSLPNGSRCQQHAIHVFTAGQEDVDGRNKSGHDGVGKAGSLSADAEYREPDSRVSEPPMEREPRMPRRVFGTI